MKIQEFKIIFQRLEELYLAAGAVGPAADLRDIMRIFENYNHYDVQTFICETKTLLNNISIRKTKPKAELDEKRVLTYAERLINADTDQTTFNIVFHEIEKDKKIKKLEWIAIANRYLNAPVDGTHIYKFKTVEAARTTIRNTFIQRFESASKREILDRIIRWPSEWISAENKE